MEMQDAIKHSWGSRYQGFSPTGFHIFPSSCPQFPPFFIFWSGTLNSSLIFHLGNAFSLRVHDGGLLTSSQSVFTSCPLTSHHCVQHPVVPPDQACSHTSVVPQGISILLVLCSSHIHHQSRKEFLPGKHTLDTKDKIMHAHTNSKHVK